MDPPRDVRITVPSIDSRTQFPDRDNRNPGATNHQASAKSKQRQRGFWQTWTSRLSQVALTAWLIPIMVLVALNLKSYIIGASAWCLRGNCFADLNNPRTGIPAANIARFNQDSRNLLGALQLVAKALEVWFALIAGNLIFTVMMWLSSGEAGLPLQFITIPHEYEDPLMLLNVSFWRALVPFSQSRLTSKSKTQAKGTGSIPLLQRRRTGDGYSKLDDTQPDDRDDEAHAQGLSLAVGPRQTGATALALPPVTSSKRNQGRSSYQNPMLWLLALLALVLCVLGNLMGPATAVLVIPTAQWLQVVEVNWGWFTSMNAGEPPQASDFLLSDSNCSALDLEQLRYSCTALRWGTVMDGWCKSWVAAAAQAPSHLALGVASHQESVTLLINTTTEPVQSNGFNRVIWIPSRQQLNQFVFDQQALIQISYGATAASFSATAKEFEPYAKYNRSLQTETIRYGPVTGATPTFWNSMQAQTWTVNIDGNRSIACFSHYRLGMAIDENNNFTKCIQSGPGWSSGSISNSFSIDGLYAPNGSVISSALTVNVTASERGVFLRNGVTETGASVECIGPFNDSRVPSDLDCDWGDLFSKSFNEFSNSNATSSITTVQVSQTVDNITLIVTADFVAFLNFTEYTFDPFIFSNPTQLVVLPDPPATGIPFGVHPAWYFAAWSVDWDNGVLPASRSTAAMFSEMMDYVRTDSTPEGAAFNGVADAILSLPILQMLSLIDWSASSEEPVPNAPVNEQLSAAGWIFVWAYSASSRTAYLGLVVVFAGSVVTVLQLVVWYYHDEESKSLTQLLLAALAYIPKEGFDSRADEDMHACLVNADGPGDLRFHC